MSAQGDIQWFDYTLTVQKKYYKNLVQTNIWYNTCTPKNVEYTIELLYIKCTDVVPNDCLYIVFLENFV